MTGRYWFSSKIRYRALQWQGKDRPAWQWYWYLNFYAAQGWSQYTQPKYVVVTLATSTGSLNTTSRLRECFVWAWAGFEVLFMHSQICHFQCHQDFNVMELFDDISATSCHCERDAWCMHPHAARMTSCHTVRPQPRIPATLLRMVVHLCYFEWCHRRGLRYFVGIISL